MRSVGLDISCFSILNEQALGVAQNSVNLVNLLSKALKLAKFTLQTKCILSVLLSVLLSMHELLPTKMV